MRETRFYETGKAPVFLQERSFIGVTVGKYLLCPRPGPRLKPLILVTAAPEL